MIPFARKDSVQQLTESYEHIARLVLEGKYALAERPARGLWDEVQRHPELRWLTKCVNRLIGDIERHKHQASAA